MTKQKLPISVHEWFRRAYRFAMSTKHIDTAADLVRFGASVKIECRSCGAAKTFEGLTMVAMCGSGSGLPQCGSDALDVI